MVISIPSSGRSGHVHTLSLVEESGLEGDTYLLVPAAQEAEYRRTTPSTITIVPLPYDPTRNPPPGHGGLLADARNLWTEQHTPGTRLTWADDDLKAVRKLNGKTLEPAPLGETIEAGWALAETARVTLWGVYPVDNAYYMRPQPAVGLAYCIGQLYGAEVTGDPEVDRVTIWGKEDYERTIRHFLHRGAVARLNDVACQSPIRAGAGGLQVVTGRLDQELDQIRYLQQLYPTLVGIRRRKNGYPEIRLTLPK